MQHGDPFELRRERFRLVGVPLEETDREVPTSKKAAHPLGEGRTTVDDHLLAGERLSGEQLVGGVEDVRIGHQEDDVLLLDTKGSVGNDHLTPSTDRGDSNPGRQRQIRELLPNGLRARCGAELLHLDLTTGEILDRERGGISKRLGDRPRRQMFGTDQAVDSQRP